MKLSSIELLPKIEEKTEVKVVEKGQVILHISTDVNSQNSAFRIWKSTYLIDSFSNERSKLLQNFNISLYPHWTFPPYGKKYTFTLVFEALLSNCVLFHFKEIIHEAGGFEVLNITRNKSDVYNIEI
jgi:hypothetical protein